MATLPYFVLGPSTVLSALGLIRGPDRTVATPGEDWRTAVVDVVIPALNEQEHVALAIASVLRQTLRPRHIILVDDGSVDRTVEMAEAYCASRGVPIVTIRRRKPIGKTPTIKRQARELDSDVEFILDADTILESPDYIERTVQELYQAAGIASACGTIVPLRRRERDAWAGLPDTRGFCPAVAQPPPWPRRRLLELSHGITNLYREVLYLFLQKFVYHGQMEFFGTTANPVGCAVAYRRKYVESLFDHFSPILGDDLTNSEDIFIGFAMLNEGYRNVQLTDVFARTVEPGVHRLPRQVYLWSSAFLQSCYYFDRLLKSPFRAAKRVREREAGRRRAAKQLRARGAPAYAAAGLGAPVEAVRGIPALESGRGAERRRLREPYRQAFGRDRTYRFGRPAGWLLMMSAVEKVFFPAALLLMALVGNWTGLGLTVAIETLIGLVVLAVVMKGRRLEYVAKGLAVAPLRYALVVFEMVTIGRFAWDIWMTKNRQWRK